MTAVLATGQYVFGMAVRETFNIYATRDGVRQWSGQTRQSLAEFCRRHPTGRFLVRKRGHAFAVINGVVRDPAHSGSRVQLTGAWEFKPSSVVETKGWE